MTLHFIRLSNNTETPGKITTYTGISEEYAVDGFDYGLEVLSKPDVLTDYFLDGDVTPRPSNPAVRDGLVLTGLPQGSKLTISGSANSNTYTVEGNIVTLAFPNPGTYKVVLSSWPYLDVSYEVTV